MGLWGAAGFFVQAEDRHFEEVAAAAAALTTSRESEVGRRSSRAFGAGGPLASLLAQASSDAASRKAAKSAKSSGARAADARSEVTALSLAPSWPPPFQLGPRAAETSPYSSSFYYALS